MVVHTLLFIGSFVRRKNSRIPARCRVYKQMELDVRLHFESFSVGLWLQYGIVDCPCKKSALNWMVIKVAAQLPGFRWCSKCVYKKSQRQRLATISAWVSFRLLPRSLMCSPFMHLVPVVTPITDTSSIADPVVMTIPAKTFLPECAGLLAISSENFSSTKLETNCVCQTGVSTGNTFHE